MKAFVVIPYNSCTNLGWETPQGVSQNFHGLVMHFQCDSATPKTDKISLANPGIMITMGLEMQKGVVPASIACIYWYMNKFQLTRVS